MKILSWNVNGLRAAVKKGFIDFLMQQQPDIICLQEIKARREQLEAFDLPGYEEYWNPAERPGYSGVAIFSREAATDVNLDIQQAGKPVSLKDDFGDANKEGRVLTVSFPKFHVVSVYTPNSKPDLSRLKLREKQWDPAFLRYLQELEATKPVIACGDYNVAHNEIDLARPKENRGKHGFTDEERVGFERLMEAGFIDSFRHQHPDQTEAYSWWSHWGNARQNNVGWRIDYALTSKKLAKKIDEAWIMPEVEGSDHCPVGLKITI